MLVVLEVSTSVFFCFCGRRKESGEERRRGEGRTGRDEGRRGERGCVSVFVQ